MNKAAGTVPSKDHRLTLPEVVDDSPSATAVIGPLARLGQQSADHLPFTR